VAHADVKMRRNCFEYTPEGLFLTVEISKYRPPAASG
jgi:hypothetical protein